MLLRLDELIPAAAIFAACLAGLTACAASRDEPADDRLRQAEAALRLRKFQDAATLATALIEQTPSARAFVIRAAARNGLGMHAEAVADFTQAIELKPDPATYMQRGMTHAALDAHAHAVADFDRAIELDPKTPGAHRQRGRELFKMGKVEQSIEAFDRYAQVEPQHEDELWERGLSRYYAKEFSKAKQSFEDYHKVGPEDIENGLWRMISQAKTDGIAAARRDLLPYEPKRRPPFPLLYDLYSDKRDLQHVLERFADGVANQEDRRTRTFYTHLYVGLWFVMHERPDQAMPHMEKAVELRSTDYMWYVARLHLMLLKQPAGE